MQRFLLRLWLFTQRTTDDWPSVLELDILLHWIWCLCSDWWSFLNADSANESGLSFIDFDECKCRFKFIYCCLLRWRFDWRLDDFFAAICHSQCVKAQKGFPPSIYVSTVPIRSFDMNTILYIFFSTVVSVLQLTKVATDAVYKTGQQGFQQSIFGCIIVKMLRDQGVQWFSDDVFTKLI